jgi:hypothetical protein
MAEFTLLLIGNLMLTGISVRSVLSKRIFSKGWPGGVGHLTLLFVSLVTLGIFCGVFVLLNSLEANNPLTESLVNGAIAGLYVTIFALLGFVIFCGVLLTWRRGREFHHMSLKMFH